jgi:hypothetical protein
VVSDGIRIEQIVKRAQEIRCSRGGMFGYDLEDYLEAERELVERNRPDDFGVRKTAHAGLLPWDQDMSCQETFRTNQIIDARMNIAG